MVEANLLKHDKIFLNEKIKYNILSEEPAQFSNVEFEL